MKQAVLTPINNSTDKAPDKIQGMFNHISGAYDKMNDIMTFGMHRGWKRIACNALHLKPGNSVLDVCTGTGDLAAILSGMVGPTGSVTAVDFSKDMLAVGQKRFSHLSNIHWKQGDALALDFPDASFDGAVISFGLRNVCDVEKCLSEMARVVKPGGWVVNLDTASDNKNPFIWWYFRAMTPVLGKLFAQDEGAYRYLGQSTRTFETPCQIAASLQAIGLSKVKINPLGFGSVSLQAGQKI